MKEGDVVAIWSNGIASSGIVRKIILPGTQDSIDWSASRGGVLIEGGNLGLSLTESLENDEDVTFVRRADGSSL